MDAEATYVDGSVGAVFPFGHGLSYTTFEYRDLVIHDAEVPTAGVVRVFSTILNTGDRHGEEVVQLYARDVMARTVRPFRQLVGFGRVRLAPGAAARVTFEIPTGLFSLWDVGEGWVVEPGVVELHVAASAADTRLTGGVRLTGDVHRPAAARAATSRFDVEDA